MPTEGFGPEGAAEPQGGKTLVVHRDAEVLDLDQDRPPFAEVPDEFRPRAADPLFELARILGPDLVCAIVKEAEGIRDRTASTHIDLRLHFLQGAPKRADWMPVRALTMGPNARRR